jgi:phage terminase large subunit-like protein
MRRRSSRILSASVARPGLSKAALLAQERDLDRLLEYRRTHRLEAYKPYAKQAEFHALGKTKRERLFRAGNQLGKTLSGAAEMALHLTGLYPDWWQGRRWERGIKAWAGSKSGEATRGGVQRLLLGEPSDPMAQGTGFIPRHTIVDVSPARGLADAIDTVTVKNANGGHSTLKFKSYEQGRERWQVETVDCVWMDEEPPADIYTEALSRTNATGGMVYVTFTPLLGVSDVVMRFIKEAHDDRSDTVMTIDDVDHISAEEKARIIASYPEHEREARTRGVPILGSGRIFPVPRSVLSVEPFPIPEWWPEIGALDFGWDHPTAAVKLRHDRDSDTIYVTHAYRASQTPVHTVAASLRAWGDMPWAWPHDGLNSTAGSPEPLAEQYRRQGMKLRPDPASYDDTRRNAVEAGLMDMLDRMLMGKFKVFAHLNDWFEEFELYHRQDGKVFKERDDLMSATRYGVMDLRFARAKTERVAMDRYERHRRSASGSGWAA